MSKKKIPYQAYLVLLILIFYGHTSKDNIKSSEKSIVFVHANVITMESESILADFSVFVKGGKIERIAPSVYHPNADSFEIINATGCYLMPGLADMHTHIWSKVDILPYVANGVTTVLNMGSPDIILQLKTAAAKKEILSPTIYVGCFVDGPGSQGYLVTTPTMAKSVVDSIVAKGWDFIKVYNSIPAGAFAALMERAKERNIAVIGHGVRAVGMEGILSAGQVMIAHAEEYLYTYFHDNLSDSSINSATAITYKSGAYVTPNLCTYETIALQWGSPANLQKMLSRPEMKYVSSFWKSKRWLQFDFTRREGNINNKYQFLQKFTKKLSDARVPLLVGTDTPFMIGEVNGFAIHDELRNLVSCGLSNYQVLQCCTKNAGDFIRKYVADSEPFGLISQNFKADLLLLSANPLVDIKNLQKRVGIMVNGQWFSESDLQQKMNLFSASLIK